MLLPITAYGHPTLKKIAKDIDKDYPNLDIIIKDMFETMYFSKGVGLAAPQIGKNLNLFVIKTPTFQEVFINPILFLDGRDIQNIESCLSFPGMEFAVNRREKVLIKYYNKDWTYLIREFDGILGIVIQHEYDHLKGKLIID